ncbi:MAG TPA: M20/M25/M40 family metallo-hydrolase, partial [Bacteroidales bacterium]|nr:M20/M25/M40 family metallo-hydrolase [Bacteroidales bacterium]
MRTFTVTVLFVFSLLSAPAQQRWDNPLDSTIAHYVSLINADSIQAYMQALENFETRFCLADNRREVAEWIMNKFISFGYTNVVLDSFPFNRVWNGQLHETWQHNVVCTKPGYKNPFKVYIMGAHHDAIVQSGGDPMFIAPGADDNASGVAATLEVARIMKSENYQPDHTIKFITFAAEELGLHGAWHYANNAAASGMDIELMI